MRRLHVRRGVKRSVNARLTTVPSGLWYFSDPLTEQIGTRSGDFHGPSSLVSYKKYSFCNSPRAIDTPFKSPARRQPTALSCAAIIALIIVAIHACEDRYSNDHLPSKAFACTPRCVSALRSRSGKSTSILRILIWFRHHLN